MSNLDRSKKYEGLGLTWAHNSGTRWRAGRTEDSGFWTATAEDHQMQAWLDAGHIKPVRETKIVRVEGVVMIKPPSGNLYTVIRHAHYDELPAGARSKPVTLEFEVEA